MGKASIGIFLVPHQFGIVLFRNTCASVSSEMKTLAVLCLFAELAFSYSFVASQPGIKNTHFLARRQQSGGANPGGPLNCPFNPDHIFPTPVTDQFPYNSAKGGKPGKGIGGYLVPAIGDEAHKFIAPTDRDIRGPCPGLNAAANHGFIARDGITNYTELVDAVQNVYNMGYDLANFLAVFSIFIADGDLVTKKLSIGCDATTRTSFNPVLTGSQPGLVGHNKFEADSSLTRNDFFLGKGDNFNFNGTLFGMMTETTGNFRFGGSGKVQIREIRAKQKRQPQFLLRAARRVYSRRSLICLPTLCWSHSVELEWNHHADSNSTAIRTYGHWRGVVHESGMSDSIDEVRGDLRVSVNTRDVLIFVPN